MLRDETEVEAFFENKNAKECFKALAKLKGEITTWSDVLNAYLFDLEKDDQERQSHQSFVGELIKRREQFDEGCYRQAVKRLFDDNGKPRCDQKYSYSPKWNKSTGIRNDLIGYKLAYYELCVSTKDAGHDDLLKIIIKAPGSKDLMSDVDTTIEVTYCDESLRQKTKWPSHFEGNNGCLKTLLQAAIVYNFNRINLEATGLTGALSRDSNAYAEKGYIKNGQEQFKFNKIRQNLLSSDTLIFLKEDDALCREVAENYKENIVRKYKQRKETQELAASLFSIREYFGKKGWQEEMLDYFETLYPYRNDQKNNIAFRKVIKEAFDLTDEWYRFYKDELNKLSEGDTEESVVYQQGYWDKVGSQFNQKPLSDKRKEDMHIDMKYYLYTKILAKDVARLQSELDKIDLARSKYSVEKLAKKLRNAGNSSDERRPVVGENKKKVKKGSLPAMDKREKDKEGKNSSEKNHEEDFLPKKAWNERIEFLKNEYSSLYLNYIKEIKKYRKNLKNKCRIKNKLQKATIKAGLFAHEAYVNFGALYHTVYWQQSQDDKLRIDRRHVVLCSVLQQIGFRLLHSKEYQKKMQLQDDVYQKALLGGEMLYRVAKYEQRVADMLLGSDRAWFDDKVSSSTEDVLKRLRGTEPVKKSTFELKFYRLLDRGTLLVKEVKKKGDVPVEQKARKALLESFRLYRIEHLGKKCRRMGISDLESIFKNREEEQKGFIRWLTVHDNKLLLEGAKKLIATTFKVKLSEKFSEQGAISDNDKVFLWGHKFDAGRAIHRHRPR